MNAIPGSVPVRAWNLYGPTETTVWSACAPLPPVAEGAPEPTLGDPVAETRLHVLGPDLHPAPDGVRGELFIGGAGLARGYHGRPGLTAERFLPDPFGEPGSRLYRTGDIACRSRGALRYRGRADDQVKIRGHRIEPGEVEARLIALPGVAAAAVIARPGPAGLRLIAYAVPAPGAALDEASLRASLTGSLPDPMIPARIAVLDALPITQNGKLDRRALPDPDTTDPTDSAAPRAEPQTDTERTLAHIWTTVLGLTHVQTTDTFFDIGGDSITAMQVVAAIRARFDRELPLRRLFETPTIAALAAELDRTAPLAARSDDIAAMLDTLDILEFADE